MAAALDVGGNPSSIHAEGRDARDRVEEARDHVARLVGAERDEIVFTSGGTEADVLGIVGLALAARAAGRAARVVTTPIEHPAALGAARSLRARGFALDLCRVDGDGVIDLDDLARHAAGAAVVAVSAVNHELGTVQDLGAIAAAARAGGAHLHVDAVQAAGKQSLAQAVAAADAIAISAHKLGGPAGAGALWIRRGVDVAADIAAGHQERERRPGTENVVGIVGFGAAAALALAAPERWHAARVAATRLQAGLVGLGARIHGAGATRGGTTVNAAWDGARGEAIVIALDLAGVACSTGAACSSGSVKPSPVLLGIGLPPERARQAVRFSTGPTTTVDEIDAVLALLPAIVARARR